MKDPRDLKDPHTAPRPANEQPDPYPSPTPPLSLHTNNQPDPSHVLSPGLQTNNDVNTLLSGSGAALGLGRSGLAGNSESLGAGGGAGNSAVGAGGGAWVTLRSGRRI